MRQRRQRKETASQQGAQAGGRLGVLARATPKRRIAALVALTALVALAIIVGLGATAISHRYLRGVSENATEGPNERVSSIEATAGDQGHMWLSERVNSGATRVNEFSAESGKYLGRQLLEEGGVSFMTKGVAIGHATGAEELYVGAGKAGEEVVAVYGPTDKLQGVWKGAQTANKSFTQSGSEKPGVLNGVAVDNSPPGPGDPQAGDVYVATSGLPAFAAFNVVDVLKAEAGGKEGAAAGQITGTCKTTGISCTGAEVVGFTEPRGVAVGPSGEVAVLDEKAIDVFEPQTTPGQYKYLLRIAGTPNGGAFKQPGSVAIDGKGHIYVAEKEANVVDEFDAEGKFVGRLAGTPTGVGGALAGFRALQSVGVDPQSGNVFVADYDPEKEVGTIDAFGAGIVLPDVEVVEPPQAIAPTGATLRGKVNPDEAGPASCEFEYGESETYGQRVPCSAVVANANAPVEVKSNSLAGLLAPDRTYFYRLDASNENGTNSGECPQDCGQFTTSGPGISGESVTEVSSSSVRLQASVDPNGAGTSYYFQYSSASTEVCEAEAACTEIPAAPGAALGSAKAPIAVSQHVQGLAPGSEYHYRLVAISQVRPGEAFFGPDQRFVTQLAGPGLKLSDQRQWELVSPADKQGALLSSIEVAGVVQAAAGGAAISYLATRPTEAGVQGYFELVQMISRRGASGWSSEDVSLAHGGAVGTGFGNGSEYRFFAEDLKSAIVEPFGEFSSLTPCTSAPDSERTPYRRQNDAPCNGRLGRYEPMVSAEDTPAGTKFGGKAGAATGAVGFLGASADAAHAVLGSRVALAEAPNPGEESKLGLYEWSAGAAGGEGLKQVSILPDGKLAPGAARLGAPLVDQKMIARGAIAEDGGRVVWSELNGHLYVREMKLGKTAQVDLPEGKCVAEKTCGGGKVEPVFQGASSDGTEIFFTDQQRLVAGSGQAPGKADLYACELTEAQGQALCKLADLTPAPGPGEGADVQGLLAGISKDASVVYYVANGALSAGAGKGDCHESKPPVGARCNLYVQRREGEGWGAAKLVAVLGGEDWPDWKGNPAAGLGSMTTRASTDGRYLAFMSDRSLTGYDNRDAVSAKPDQEVFLYDASGGGGAGQLLCASCDPTGARPEGVEYEKLKGGLVGVQNDVWANDQGIAANVPGWTSFKPQEARYQSRYLTDQGRLFFDSAVALVPQDVNHNQDVYQYEPVGVGGCTAESPGYSAAKGGCVNLISSGAAAGESGFIDASESGNDVFFLTGERLVKEDVDTALDVYDAHVCSPDAPCRSEVQGPPACTTADSCRPPASAQPSIFGAPASATFAGAGNLFPLPAAPGAVAKAPPSAAQKLAAALRACHKHKPKKQQIACEAKARKRYPVKQASVKARAKAKGPKR